MTNTDLASRTEAADKLFDEIEHGMAQIELTKQTEKITEMLEHSNLKDAIKHAGESASLTGTALKAFVYGVDWPVEKANSYLEPYLETDITHTLAALGHELAIRRDGLPKSYPYDMFDDEDEQYPETDLYDGCGDGLGYPDSTSWTDEERGIHAENQAKRGKEPKKPFVPKPHLTQRPFIRPELLELRKALVKK